MTRPNILLITADQMRADCLQAVNPTIRTPNLQRLVDRGILFTKAYAPTPVCLPCRASILTGQFPSTHGAMHNESHLPQDYPSDLSKILSRAGYETRIIGKSHLNTMHDKTSPESAPHVFNYDHFRKWNGPWYGFKRADICVGHTTERIAASMHYGAWLEDKGVDIQKYFGNTGYADYGTWDLPVEYHANAWIYECFSNAIDSRKAGDNPFFYWINFPDPHNPCFVPEPWASMYDPSEIKTHGFKTGEPGSFATKPPFYAEIVEDKGSYKSKPSDPGLPGPGNVSSLQWNEKEVRENAAHYYGMVSFMDSTIGKIIDKLSVEELENTIIVFTADHGDFLGDHGLFWKSIVSFEEAMNVPLIVSYPALLPRGIKSNSLHSLIDLAPTFVHMAGMDIPASFEGVNQLPTWLDPAKSQREDVMVEERPYNTDFNVRVLITPEYKFCFYPSRDYGELYDVKKDPDQIHNLWGDEGFTGVVMKLMTRLLSYTLNKRNPNPNHVTRILSRYPRAQRDFPEHVNEVGTLVKLDNGTIIMPLTFTNMGTNFVEIPIEDILEDFINVDIFLTINGTRCRGKIEMRNNTCIFSHNDGGKIHELEFLLEPCIGSDVHLLGLINDEIGEDGTRPKYHVIFNLLF
ncbi:MAG: sulfatase family protein [Promethearchaeota archaeon]